MKKYIAIATLALLAGAACSKVETVESTVDTPITFSVVNHLAQTKATSGYEYPQTSSFGTFAWWNETGSGWDAKLAASEDPQTVVFMDNQKVSFLSSTWQPVDASAGTATPYYWTKTGSITFASYSPYTNGSDKGFSAVPTYDPTDGFKFTNYTVQASDSVEGEDVLYSDLAKDCQGNTNDVTNDLGSHTDDNFKGVPTLFNHALCQVGFAFRAIGPKNPNVSSITIKVTNVELLNINSKGSFTQTASTKWSSDHSVAGDRKSYTFSVPTGFADLDLIANTPENTASTTNYSDLGVTKILLPQTLVDSSSDPSYDVATTTDQVLSISYEITINYTAGTSTTETITDARISLAKATLTEWSDNKNITYRISINPYADNITFDPAVKAWTDEFGTYTFTGEGA